MELIQKQIVEEISTKANQLTSLVASTIALGLNSLKNDNVVAGVIGNEQPEDTLLALGQLAGQLQKDIDRLTSNLYAIL